MTMPFEIPARIRPTVERFAAVVCPPELGTRGLMPALMHEVQLYMGAMPPHVRFAVMTAFVTFDQGARLWPAARGRRFTDLDDERADRYYRAVAHGPIGVERNLIKLMKGIITFNYYELAEVKAALEYHPDAWIAEVARRRIDSYADVIRRGEDAVLAGDQPKVARLSRPFVKEGSR